MDTPDTLSKKFCKAPCDQCKIGVCNKKPTDHTGDHTGNCGHTWPNESDGADYPCPTKNCGKRCTLSHPHAGEHTCGDEHFWS